MNGLNELFPDETSIAISNLHTFIYYHHSTEVDLKIQPGDIVHENTVTFKALQQKQRIAEIRNNHLFKVPYYAISMPIINDGIVLGAITSILPREPLLFSTRFLTVKTTNSWVPVSFENITFLEARNRKTYVHSTVGNSTHRMNLSELEASLPNDTFVRCHRSYIVNLNHIQEIHPDSHSTFLLIMKGKARIPISQSFASHFRKLLNF